MIEEEAVHKPKAQLPPCLPDRKRVQAGWKKPRYRYGYCWVKKGWRVTIVVSKVSSCI